MNKLFYATLLLACISCNDEQQESFTVEGTIKNNSASIVYLQENPVEAQPVIVDSSKVEADGSFKLNAVVKGEGLFRLRANDDMFPFALLINDVDKV